MILYSLKYNVFTNSTNYFENYLLPEEKSMNILELCMNILGLCINMYLILRRYMFMTTSYIIDKNSK